MNVFYDVAYRSRFKQCWEIMDSWKIKEECMIPADEHDPLLLEQYSSPKIILDTFDTLGIKFKLRDELLILCEICCQNTILCMVMLRYIYDTIRNGNLLPEDYEITSKDFMWVFPVWPLMTKTETYIGGIPIGANFSKERSAGDIWYTKFIFLMQSQQDFRSSCVNKCETRPYWDEIIQK